MKTNLTYTLNFEEISLKDLSRVGGKNASLGELFNAPVWATKNVADLGLTVP